MISFQSCCMCAILRTEKLVWFHSISGLAFGSIQSILLTSKFLDLLPWIELDWIIELLDMIRYDELSKKVGDLHVGSSFMHWSGLSRDGWDMLHWAGWLDGLYFPMASVLRHSYWRLGNWRWVMTLCIAVDMYLWYRNTEDEKISEIYLRLLEWMWPWCECIGQSGKLNTTSRHNTTRSSFFRTRLLSSKPMTSPLKSRQ